MSGPESTLQPSTPRIDDSASPGPSTSMAPPTPPPCAPAELSPQASTSQASVSTKRQLPDALVNNCSNVPAVPSRPKRPRANVKSSPPRTGKAPARRITANVTTPGVPRTSSSSEVTNICTLKPSGDFCSACGAAGLYVCCDGCPRVFHPFCLEPPLAGVEDAGEHWYCRECETSKGRLSSTTSTPNDLFSRLIEQQSVENPRAFKLPESLRNRYEYVATNPFTGEFIDQSRVKTKKKLESTKGYVEEPDPFRIKTKDGKSILCYTCGLGASSQKKLRIVGCDVCDHYFHLDCLEPPLVAPPPASIKWICPLHVEKAAPSRRLLKDSVIVPIHKLNVPNNGDIDIIPSPQKRTKARKVEEISINRVRYQVPENIVILDFWAKLGKTKELQLLSGQTCESSPLTPLSSTAGSPHIPILGRDILPPSAPSSEDLLTLRASPSISTAEEELDDLRFVKEISKSPSCTSTSPQLEPLIFKKGETQAIPRPDLSFLLEAARQSFGADQATQNAGLFLLGDAASSKIMPPDSSSKHAMPKCASGEEVSLSLSNLIPSTSRSQTRDSARIESTPSSKPSKACESGKAKGAPSLEVKSTARRRRTAKNVQNSTPSGKKVRQGNAIPRIQEQLKLSKTSFNGIQTGTSDKLVELNQRIRQRSPVTSGDRLSQRALGDSDNNRNSNDEAITTNNQKNFSSKSIETVLLETIPLPTKFTSSAENVRSSFEPPKDGILSSNSDSGAGADTDVDNLSNKPLSRIKIKGTKYLGPSASPPSSQIIKSPSPVVNLPLPSLESLSKSKLAESLTGVLNPMTSSSMSLDKATQLTSAAKPGNLKRPRNVKGSGSKESESPVSHKLKSDGLLTLNCQTPLSASNPHDLQSLNSNKSTRQSNFNHKISSNHKTSSVTLKKDSAHLKESQPCPGDAVFSKSNPEYEGLSRPKKRVRRSHPAAIQGNSESQLAPKNSNKAARVTSLSSTSPSHVPLANFEDLQNQNTEVSSGPVDKETANSSKSGVTSKTSWKNQVEQSAINLAVKSSETFEQAPNCKKPSLKAQPATKVSPTRILPEKVEKIKDSLQEFNSSSEPKISETAKTAKNKAMARQRSRKPSKPRNKPPVTSTSCKVLKGAAGIELRPAPKTLPRTKKLKQVKNPSLSESLASNSDKIAVSITSNIAGDSVAAGEDSNLKDGDDKTSNLLNVLLTPPPASCISKNRNIIENSRSEEQRDIVNLVPKSVHPEAQLPSSSTQLRNIVPKKSKVKRKSRLSGCDKISNGSFPNSIGDPDNKITVHSSPAISASAPRPRATSFVPHPQNPLTLVPHSQPSMPFVAHPQNPMGFVPHPQHGIAFANSAHQQPFVTRPQFPIPIIKPEHQLGFDCNSNDSSLPSSYSGRPCASLQDLKSALAPSTITTSPSLPSATATPIVENKLAVEVFRQPHQSKTVSDDKNIIALPFAQTLNSSNQSWE